MVASIRNVVVAQASRQQTEQSDFGENNSSFGQFKERRSTFQLSSGVMRSRKCDTRIKRRGRSTLGVSLRNASFRGGQLLRIALRTFQLGGLRSSRRNDIVEDVVDLVAEPVLDLAGRHGVVVARKSRFYGDMCFVDRAQDLFAMDGESGAGEVGVSFVDQRVEAVDEAFVGKWSHCWSGV
jgi:hypothetical protein